MVDVRSLEIKGFINRTNYLAGSTVDAEHFVCMYLLVPIGKVKCACNRADIYAISASVGTIFSFDGKLP